MKSTFLTICTMFLTSTVFGQDYKLPDILDIMRSGQSTAKRNFMLSETNPAVFCLRENRLNSFIRESSRFNEKPQSYQDIYNKNSRNILFGLTQVGESISKEQIVQFALKNGVDTCVVIGQFEYGNVFNTLRTDERQRVSRVVSELLLPTAYTLFSSLKDSNFKYIAVTAYYGKRDFSDGPHMNTGCFIACLFDRKLLEQVNTLELAEEDIIDMIDIYVADNTDVKKIRIGR